MMPWNGDLKGMVDLEYGGLPILRFGLGSGDRTFSFGVDNLA